MGKAAYFSSWYTKPRSCCLDLKIIMIRSSKPIKFAYAGIFQFSARRFTSVSFTREFQYVPYIFAHARFTYSKIILFILDSKRCLWIFCNDEYFKARVRTASNWRQEKSSSLGRWSLCLGPKEL